MHSLHHIDPVTFLFLNSSAIKYMWTFLKMPSYPGSAHRKFSVSLPESRWALDGQQLVLLLGDSEDREGPERQEKPILMIFHTVRSVWHFNWENVWYVMWTRVCRCTFYIHWNLRRCELPAESMGVCTKTAKANNHYLYVRKERKRKSHL